jgi:3-methyl-2-oxobutanoate hydroxymethyltransferase
MAGRNKTTISTLRNCKREGRRFSMLTCYDHATAQLMEEAGIDSLLVGDTYAEVCLGHSTTLPATLDHMVTLSDAVRRGAPSAYLVGDMPYLTYQVSREEAIRNAGRFMAEGGCDCVKVEVDHRLVETVEAMSTASIPVMAHLGLKPQSIQMVGGYKIQGRRADEALRLLDDVRLMEEVGAVAVLLEAVPVEVAKAITELTALPVIGIASGPYCDGQVLVMHDMLGYQAGHPPRAVKQYARLAPLMVDAFRAYAAEVTSGAFPTIEQSVSMEFAELERLRSHLPRSAREQVVKTSEKQTARRGIRRA